MSRAALLAVLGLLAAGRAASADERPAVLTLGGGIGRPDGTSAFETTFGDELGPLLGAELQVGLLQVPHVGWVGVGLGIGWASFSGSTCLRANDGNPDCTNRTSEDATLILVPMTALASLRIDVLARELGVPLVFTPKLGLETVYYKSRAGEIVDGEGFAVGLRWAVEVALEIDALDREASQSLRRDSGVEHAFIFGQVFGSPGQSQVVADSFGWTAGLGFSF